MSRVFISYRRNDTRWVARALKNKLANAIGEEQVFMDIDSIDPGVDFVEVLEQAISQVDALIVVIGPRFLTVKDDNGNRRIDNPNDFVRLEIGAALKRDIRVIPLLETGTPLPSQDDLPDELKPLARRNAVQVGESSFDSDIDRIVKSLERLFAEKDSGQSADLVENSSKPQKSKGWAVPLSTGVAVLAIVGLILWISGVFSPIPVTGEKLNPTPDTKQPVTKQPVTKPPVTKPPVTKSPVAVDGLVWISPGTFQMGSPVNEAARNPDEKQHEVKILEGYYLGEFEVTRDQYDQVMGTDFGQSGQSNLPVVNVSWDDARQFFQRLNKMSEIPKDFGIGNLPPDYKFTLPSEAQWEYACRAGNKAMGWDEEWELYELAVCYVRSKTTWTEPKAVGSMKPNAWKLYDMLGNVEEWCLDVYAEYSDGPLTNPVVTSGGNEHVIRGGYFNTGVGPDAKGHMCRAAVRVKRKPSARSQTCGFRVAAVRSK